LGNDGVCEMSAPVFHHRIDGEITDTISLTDTISMMAHRAGGVLKLVSVNLNSDTRASDEIVQAAIDAVIAEIEDINVTIQTHHRLVNGGAA
jgi:hypothetical protein